MSDEEKIERTSANENSWYWLATVYGEPREGSGWHLSDPDVTAKNRTAWNRWMAPALSNEHKAELIAKGFDAAELTPFNDAERKDFLRDFAIRAGVPKESPANPKDPGSFSFRCVEFARPVDFGGYVFANSASFHKAAFLSPDFSNNEVHRGYESAIVVLRQTLTLGCARPRCRRTVARRGLNLERWRGAGSRLVSTAGR